MENLITEIYKSHKRRQETLQQLVIQTEEDLQSAKDKLIKIQTAREKADELEKKIKLSRAMSSSRKKTPSQINDEISIKEIRTIYSFNTLRKAESLVNKLESKLETLRKNYSVYDKDDLDSFDFDDQDELDLGNAEKAAEDSTTNAYYDITELPMLEWIPWPKIKLPPFGMSKLGIGPGEARLEKILGAEIQGPSSPFDLITPDGMRWEVKGLKSASDLIRPAPSHATAYGDAKAKLTELLDSIKHFANQISDEVIESLEDPRTEKIISITKRFVDMNYDKIVKKSEISSERIDKLIKIVNLLAEVLEKYTENDEAIAITIADTIKYNITKADFSRISRIMSNYDQDIEKSIDNMTLSLSYLDEPAFKDPDSFFEEVEAALDVTDIFEEVDGLIIVNEQKGFQIIPKNNISDVLEWSKVSTGVPRLQFMRF